MKIRITPSAHKIVFHDQLEPKLWQDQELATEVRDALIRIAEDFSTKLEIPIIIEDVRFTGSLANYNYSKHSDLDLHLVIDFSKVSNDTNLVKQFFDSRRIIWNQKHDIKIKGYEVEVYVENLNEKHFSTGIYSLTKNEWIERPSPEKPKIDYRSASRKAGHLKKEIDAAVGSGQGVADLKRIKEKIKKLRTCGLEHGGEYSIENLAFKILRRSGYLKKLSDAYIKQYDKNYSLPEIQNKT